MGKWTPLPPTWASELVKTVCRDENVPEPGVVEIWTNRVDPAPAATGRYFSKYHGRAWPSPSGELLEVPRTAPVTRLYVSFGKAGGHDDFGVVLHELAHHVNSMKRQGGGHDRSFWLIAFRLFQRYALQAEKIWGLGFMDQVLARSARYKAGAVEVAVMLGLSGAVEARYQPVNPTPRDVAHWAAMGKPLAATPKVGDRVRVGDKVRPAYMIGATGVVIRYGSTRVWFKLDRTLSSRFAAGTEVSLKPSCLEVI